MGDGAEKCRRERWVMRSEVRMDYEEGICGLIWGLGVDNADLEVLILPLISSVTSGK